LGKKTVGGKGGGHTIRFHLGGREKGLGHAPLRTGKKRKKEQRSVSMGAGRKEGNNVDLEKERRAHQRGKKKREGSPTHRLKKKDGPS